MKQERFVCCPKCGHIFESDNDVYMERHIFERYYRQPKEVDYEI